MLRFLLFLTILFFGLPACSQHDFYENYPFTEADTLRGALRPERSCYDVTFYELDLRIDPTARSLAGYVDIHFSIRSDFTTLQIDLYENMTIDSIVFAGRSLPYERRHAAVFVTFPLQQQGKNGRFRIYYHGRPQVANNPPWDGGFVWAKDRNRDPWIGVACEGDGASLWWPNKDHLSDEPDSMAIRISVPKGLMCVANGNLHQTVDQGDYQRWDWWVSYPINNYNVTVNIANYTHFSDQYIAQDGDTLALDYYVLPMNEAKARAHFQQVGPMLACFEAYFGKYPFWRDGFALVETPYLGMEHQSAIAYGNRYMRGYLGGMIPRGMDWDYIIIHETGHEYFGNSISSNDLAEMWIHESFTTYMESLYIECRYSYEEAVNYLVGQRLFIANQEPILGPMHVNWEHWEHSDHYYKGAWILHTLRHAIQDDALWFKLLKDFYQTYAISNITTQDFVDFVNQRTGQDWSAFFEQYLEYPGLPTLEYEVEAQKKDLNIRYRWRSDAAGFQMPVLLGKAGDYQLVRPNQEWQAMTLRKVSPEEFEIPRQFFLIDTKKTN